MPSQPLSLLHVLQQHAELCGERLAHRLPDRDISYRRLWSRIERASARLQGEWGVQAGSTVAYCGQAHPDALVLWFALQRLGAKLLPCEHPISPGLLHSAPWPNVSLVLHDDGLPLLPQCADLPAYPLSRLLATWSHHQPQLIASAASEALLYLPNAQGAWQLHSLESLGMRVPQPAVAHRAVFAEADAEAYAGLNMGSHTVVSVYPSEVGLRLFEDEVLSEIVLPNLQQAQSLSFESLKAALDRIDATDRIRIP